MSTRRFRIMPLITSVIMAGAAGVRLRARRGVFRRTARSRRGGSQAIIADQLKGQVDISAGSYIAYISAQAAGARFRVQDAIAKYDNLPSIVTTAMALPGYPTGPVAKTRIQRVAVAMLQYGILSPHYAAEVEQGTLVESMLGPAS
jgi:hypothetical protein